MKTAAAVGVVLVVVVVNEQFLLDHNRNFGVASVFLLFVIG